MLGRNGRHPLRNDSDREFVAIDNEASRSYTFPFDAGFDVTIDAPRYLSVSRSGFHYVVDADDVVHVVPPGWVRLSWKPAPGKPHVVA